MKLRQIKRTKKYILLKKKISLAENITIMIASFLAYTCALTSKKLIKKIKKQPNSFNTSNGAIVLDVSCIES